MRTSNDCVSRRADISSAGGGQSSHGAAEQAAERHQSARPGRFQAPGLRSAMYHL